MQPTYALRWWWNPARSRPVAAISRLNFSSWRWQETQNRLSRSFAASAVRNSAPHRRAPTTPIPHDARQRSRGRRIAGASPFPLGLTDRDRHRLGEHDARRRAAGAPAREHLARRRRHRPNGRRPLGAEVKRGADRIGPGLLGRLDRPHDLALRQLLQGEVALLVEDHRAVEVLLESRSAAVDPFRLFVTVAPPDLRRGDDDPAVALKRPRLETEIGVDQEHADDAVPALHRHGDLSLLAGLEARRRVEHDRSQFVHELDVGEQLLAIGGRHLLVRTGPVFQRLVVLVLLHLAVGDSLRLVPELLLRERRVAARAGGREVRDVAERPARVAVDAGPD